LGQVQLSAERPVRVIVLLLSLLLAAAPAAAQDWPSAPEYDVLLTSFEIQPALIRLKAGEPVRLRFVNNSEQGHSFSAPGFFAHARLRGRDRERVKGGALVAPPLSETTIMLVPTAGRYPARGDNLFRRMLGMRATIVVE
jgi:plastocyanin